MDDAITLPDGRLLDIYVSGPEGGLPLVFHHGTPGARTPERAIERAAHARGLRYVSASRPGYGSSTRLAGRRVSDAVGDTKALLTALGADECVVAGHSGGGPHALACAAGLAGVQATLVIASPAPPDAAGLDLLAGMGRDNVVEFTKAFAGETDLRPYLEAQRAELVGVDADQLAAGMAALLPEVDLAAMTDEAGEDLVASFGEALREGIDGWVDDDLAFVTPWGFPAAAIKSPVTLWQGDADLMVPFAHGRWLADTIPGVDANLLAGEGHISIAVGEPDRLLDALLASVQAPRGRA
jgi:pimeloyl-ACP methyl ester carboxylesterase